MPTVNTKKIAKSPNRGSLLLKAINVLRGLYMNEQALIVIVNTLNGYTDLLRVDWPDSKKEQIIFSRWALEEILELVWDHPWILASETIEAFALKLEIWSATAATEGQKRIFAVAAETAWKFLEDITEVEC